MAINAVQTYDIDVEDVEYLRHGDKPLLARLFKPRGAGPFPLMIDLHGGAWCNGDRLNDTIINEALAKSGVVVAALDFRVPPEASYPGSFVDIHYGIRWFKTQAETLRCRPGAVGAIGISSGGHQAMLLGMRPHDPRYAALELPAEAGEADASLSCVVMCWPVIDPLGRYNYAKKLKADGNPFGDRVLPLHDQYWQTEETMAEGNPVLALERGEQVELPPVLYLQGTEDTAHPRPHLDRFVEFYRRAGGSVDLELFEGEASGFTNHDPQTPAGERGLELMIAFVHKHLG